MNKNTIAFAGFVSALSFSGIDTALKISLSTVCVLILSWLSVRIPFLFDELINKIFIVAVWSAAAQILLFSLGTSEKELLFCFIANMSVITVLSHEFKKIIPCCGIIIVLSALIGWLEFTSSLALSLIVSGLVTAGISRRKNA